MKAPLLHRMDEVALIKDLPEEGLRYGATGVIIQASRGGVYDIEFENVTGKSVILRGISKEDLVLVRHRSDLMDS